MNRLVFRAGELDAFRDRLLVSSLETAAFVLARATPTLDGGHRLLVRRLISVPHDAYEVRTEQSIRLSPTFVAGVIKAARTASLSVILVHTHPFDGDVEASAVDLAGEDRLLPVLRRRIPGVPHGRLILGYRDIDSALFISPNETQELRVQGVGLDLTTMAVNVALKAEAVFDRQVRAFGAPGQSVLRTLRVAIVGLGGMGSIVAEQLAHLGLTKFMLIDPDLIEPTNLNRVVGATERDLGHRKVSVAAEAIRRIRPSADVTEVADDVLNTQAARRLLDVDFVFCCTDSHGSRALLTQMAYQYFLPVLDMGVRIDSTGGRVDQIAGRVQLLAPGLACLVCENLLDPEAVRRDLLTEQQRADDRYIVGSPDPQPAVISLNGTVASLAVTMFLSIVAGIPIRTRHQVVLFHAGTVRSIASDPDPSCVVCSASGASGRADEWPLPVRVA